MLTNVDDINYKILLGLDGKSIISLCNSSSKYKNYCNTEFWTLKFKYDGIPIINTPSSAEYIKSKNTLMLFKKMMIIRDLNVKMEM